MAGAVDGQGAAFQVGAARPLFPTRARILGYAYDVSPDGQRFLINRYGEETTSVPITVVVNWTAGLKK